VQLLEQRRTNVLCIRPWLPKLLLCLLDLVEFYVPFGVSFPNSLMDFSAGCYKGACFLVFFSLAQLNLFILSMFHVLLTIFICKS
jgi:hypothetical protein